jgi:hypothetical protein
MNGISRSTREWIASASRIRQTPMRQQVQKRPIVRATTQARRLALLAWSVGRSGPAATAHRSTAKIRLPPSAWQGGQRSKVPYAWFVVSRCEFRIDFSKAGNQAEATMNRSPNLDLVTRYRLFESGLLQRGASCEPDFLD